jgi:hypothetical protein
VLNLPVDKTGCQRPDQVMLQGAGNLSIGNAVEVPLYDLTNLRM